VENNPTNTPGDTGSTGQSGGAMGDMAQQAKETAGHVAQQAKEKAGDLLGQAREQLRTQLTSQKDNAAGTLGSIAEAVRTTGEQLREQGQAAPVGQVADRAAGWIEDLSGYLRERNIEDLTMEVESFARQQPALFLGSAFALGFLAARFLTSSSPSNGMSGRGYSGSYAGGASYSGTGYGSQMGTGGLPARQTDVGLPPDETAAGSVWSGEPTADSPRGRPIHVKGQETTSGTGAAATGDTDDTADDYQLSGSTGE